MSLLLLWGFIGYGMSTILVYGSIFETPRKWIKNQSKFFGDLISCILCTSTWVGFFLSIVLGGLINKIFDLNWFFTMFFDGMFTAGIVWTINAIVEFFEESRIK
jgi:hypothetical protein